MSLLPGCGAGPQWLCFQRQSENERGGSHVSAQITHEALHTVYQQSIHGDITCHFDGFDQKFNKLVVLMSKLIIYSAG